MERSLKGQVIPIPSFIRLDYHGHSDQYHLQ
jgi:hypothetical protein